MTSNFKYIVIILHGYSCKTERYNSVKKTILECYPDAEVIIEKLGMTSFSVADPDNIVIYAMGLVDAAWKKHENTGDQRRVIIMGHSIGAVLARKLYAAACGENDDAPFEKNYGSQKEPREWAKDVERIILFAGMNRGWSFNHHLYNKTAILMRIGIAIGHLFRFFGFAPLGFKVKKGGSFITQLRIQWLSMLRHAKKKSLGNALTIQLLGTVDDLISPEDNVDLVTGSHFIYLEVPSSDHLSIVDMEAEAGKKRKAVFEKALTASADELVNMQVLPCDQQSLKVDEDVTDVVFVIHGIRDTGYWTQKIARRVKALGDTAGRKFATETSTYGYFPMLPFLSASVRRKKMEWLMDQYTENLAQYPNARFSFMGHSNGTYLLARALKEYPACKFNNVVFAGSVVHTKFDWSEMIRQKRVNKFYNFVASSDWVVAMFPKTFQRLRIQDLGSGGFDGFSSKLSEPYQLKFIKGAHGAAIQEKYWDEIANFIVHGAFSKSVEGLAIPARSRFMIVLGSAAPLPFLIILGLLIWGGWAIVHGVYGTYGLTLGILALFLYVFIIYKIVTKM